MSWGYYGWRPYVPVAQRRANAAREIAKMRKKNGGAVNPVLIEGRAIAKTFWGQGWCDQLENHCDFENRLPRGRTYVRNGSVMDLQIEPGRVTALVSGSELYKVEVKIEPLPAGRWAAIRRNCAGKIGSLLELVQGTLSDQVMAIISDPVEGLFPRAQEIKMKCSCPDWATLCKHVAAALYGVGARLDQQPELLFTLRQVDHNALVSEALAAASAAPQAAAPAMAEAEVAAVFGIELEAAAPAPVPAARPQAPRPPRGAKKKNAARVKNKTKPAKRGVRKTKKRPRRSSR